jgi:hypothetical protein
MTAFTDLTRHLDRWIRRRRFQRSLRWAAIGTAAGAGIALAIALYAVISLNLIASGFLAAGSIALAAGTAIGFLTGLVWPVDPAAAAREFDLEFELKERVSTALDLQTRQASPALAGAQLADALTHAGQVDEKQRLPLRLPAAPLLLFLLLVGATAAVWFTGQDRFAAAAELRQTRDVILAEAERIEALVEQILADEDLTEEQKDELLDPLEQALTELEDAETLEETYSALEEAEEKLRSLENPEAEAAAEGLQTASEEALAEGPSGPLEPFEEHLSEGDLEQAAQDLREVDAEAMEQAERERLAEQLESLADALEGIDPDLAETLREAAQAAREGDTQSAEEALEQAAQAIEEIAEAAQASQAAGQAGDEMGESQAAIVQAGQGEGEGAGPDGIAVIPDGSGGEGSGEEGSGAGEGEGEGEGSEGGEAGENPIGQGNSPDGTGETDFQPITPSSVGGEGSDWVAVPPSGVDGDNVTGQGPSDPGNTAPITVPYTDVLPQYQAAVNAAIDSGIIPPQYRDLVRDYFSSLEP